MRTDLTGVMQFLFSFSLVMTAQLLLVLLLRKPMRRWLGAVAAYRLWLLVVLWLPLYAIGGQFTHWLHSLSLGGSSTTGLPANAFTLELLPNLFQFNLDWADAGAAGVAHSTTHYLWPALVLVWLTGVCGVVAWQGYQWLRFSRYVHAKGIPVAVDALPTSQLSTLVAARVSVVSLPGMNGAALFGIRQPVLLLPELFCQQHDHDQQFIILAHEAVHLRRHDNLWNLGAGLLLAVFWFNPLVLLAWRYYRFDQELSCDAQALNACNHSQQQRYARTLLDSIALLPAIGPQPLLSAWDNVNDLKERIVMITQHLLTKARPATVQTSLAVIAVIGAIATLLLTDLVSPGALAATPDQPGNKPKPVVQAPAQTPSQAEIKNESSVHLSGEFGKVFFNTRKLFDAGKFEDVLASSSELQQLLAGGKLTDQETTIALGLILQAHWSMKNYYEGRKILEVLSQRQDISPKLKMQFQYQLGESWILTGDSEKGLPYLLRAVEEPKFKEPNTYYLIALCYYKLKKIDQAVPFLEQAIALEKDKPNEAYAKMLVVLYMEMKQFDKAESVVKELVRLYPTPENQRMRAAIESKLAAAR